MILDLIDAEIAEREHREKRANRLLLAMRADGMDMPRTRDWLLRRAAWHRRQMRRPWSVGDFLYTMVDTARSYTYWKGLER